MESYLRRDVSLSNIMLRSHGCGFGGFIIDLDYAVHVDQITMEIASSGANHRKGTLPFMAIVILQKNHKRHLYCHDVESFVMFYFECVFMTSVAEAIYPIYPTKVRLMLSEEMKRQTLLE